ncbi:MAG TPA: esterase-like activity of phytase family protein, partial [Thermomicrobiales bacterium]|nr:esterase-like activity of phytase family protein [Thermomicrobiales bacterium]
MVLVLIGLLLVGCSGPDDGDATATGGPVATATIRPPATLTTVPVASETASEGPAIVPGSATKAATTTVAPMIEMPTATATMTREAAVCAVGVELLAYSDALDKVSYDDDIVGGLSALAWSGEGDLYAALSDRGSRVYTLDFPAPEDPTIVAEVRLLDASGEVDFTIDGEGIAVLPGGELLVSSETEPAIRHYAADGAFIADLPVPEHFLVAPEGRASGNGTFESLTLSPSGTRLFAALEEPLDGDGTT